MLTYNHAMLFALGLLGVLLHNLVGLHKLNKATNGKMKIMDYWQLEMFSIAISIVMAFASTIVSDEIYNALVKIGYDWAMRLSFITIGYMGQSLLAFVMGKANTVIGKPNDENMMSADKKP